MPPEFSKTDPHPLDAYQSAKPDEPVFTLQGGDPFAIPALMHYIDLRRQAGILLEDGPERQGELIRCTEAETVLWAMKSYQRGYQLQLEEEEKGIPTEIKALELHDFREASARMLARAFSELNDIRIGLAKLEFTQADGHADHYLKDLVIRLRYLYNSVEPRGSRHLEHPERID